jgi:hypothetical protein
VTCTRADWLRVIKLVSIKIVLFIIIKVKKLHE